LSWFKIGRLPSEAGKVPGIELFDKSKRVRPCKEPKTSGIWEFKLLFAMERVESLLRERPLGMLPVSMLLSRSMAVARVSWLKDDGMVPENELPVSVTRVHLLPAGGSGSWPLNELFVIVTEFALPRADAGRLPVRPLLRTIKLVKEVMLEMSGSVDVISGLVSMYKVTRKPMLEIDDGMFLIFVFLMVKVLRV